jgi:hypothetical protein
MYVCRLRNAGMDCGDDTYQTCTNGSTNRNHLQMARLQTTLQLLGDSLLDIIVLTSRHGAAVDERGVVVVSDVSGGLLLEVDHVHKSRVLNPKNLVRPQFRR